jgi:hypothetical protein
MQSNHPRQNVNEGDISEILLTRHRGRERHHLDGGAGDALSRKGVLRPLFFRSGAVP